ncbi:MAG: VWA domain-containing protein [Polyangiaceae bacterium]|nr:VWA domain-containing protein [Polyangiaceae bacterium]
MLAALWATAALAAGCSDEPQAKCGQQGESCEASPASCSSTPIELTLPKSEREIVVLIDQSGTGLCPLESDGPCDGATKTEDDPATRWNQTRAALLADDGLVAKLAARGRVGLAFYSNVDERQECPEFTDLAPVEGDLATLRRAYEAQVTRNHQPTGDAFVALTSQLEGKGAGGAIVVLVTNGSPDSCDDPDANGQAEPIAATVDAIKNAAAQGVTTFVVGMGRDPSERESLQRFALAGRAMPANAAGEAYFPVGAERGVIDAFDELVFGERACVFSLSTPLSSQDAARSRAALDGEDLAYGGADGWRLAEGGAKVEVVGKACELVRRGAQRLALTPNCGE